MQGRCKGSSAGARWVQGGAVHVLSRGLEARSVGPPRASRPHSCYGEAPPLAWQGVALALSLGVT